MRDDRQVKFNVAIANYKHGQIVNYSDMPPGHQFWVDNKSILVSDRICEFVEMADEKKLELKLKAEIEAKKKAKEEAEEAATVKIELKLKARAEKDQIAADEKKEKAEAWAKSEEERIAKEKDDKDNENNTNPPGSENDKKEDAVCPGINSDDTPCTRTKLRENGYCWPHRFQAERNNKENITIEANSNTQDDDHEPEKETTDSEFNETTGLDFNFDNISNKNDSDPSTNEDNEDNKETK